MDDLRRTAGRTQAVAKCLRCDFEVSDVWPDQARERARQHALETGHAVCAYQQTGYCKPDGA